MADTTATTPQEKILFATISCIEQKGIQNLTNRDIAKEAGVNSAAINYYFGSKDNLVEQALGITLREFELMFPEAVEAGGGDPKKILQSFFYAAFVGSSRFPAVMKAHLYNPIFQNDYDNKFCILLKDMLEKLAQVASEAYPKLDKTSAKLSISQLFSAVVFPNLMPLPFEESTELDFSTPEGQKKYLETLFTHFFA